MTEKKQQTGDVVCAATSQSRNGISPDIASSGPGYSGREQLSDAARPNVADTGLTVRDCIPSTQSQSSQTSVAPHCTELISAVHNPARRRLEAKQFCQGSNVTG